MNFYEVVIQRKDQKPVNLLVKAPDMPNALRIVAESNVSSCDNAEFVTVRRYGGIVLNA